MSRRAAPRAGSIAGRCPLVPPISRTACRLVVVPVNTVHARLELVRGGKTLAVLGERQGTVWQLFDLHDRPLRRVLPVLEARACPPNELSLVGSSLAGVHQLPTLRQLAGRSSP